MKLILTGVQAYFANDDLVFLIQQKTGWETEKLRSFLAKNNTITFSGIDPQTSSQILEGLETLGFNLDIRESDWEVQATLGAVQSRDMQIAILKRDFARLAARLEALEMGKPAPSAVRTPSAAPVYQERATRMPASAVVKPVKAVPKTTAEGNIGKYWLSRIGIFTLILGIVLFISYSIQFIGPVGKILTGLVLGILMVGCGNYLAMHEKYRGWAMATIGGGWAIVYFSIYAAYAVPATKIIHNPLVGMAGLFVTSVLSISQSLKFKSPVMVGFSYFLAFLSITMTGVSHYTLVASFLLAVSIVVVTKKMGWSWLALLGLCAVYLTHFVWLEPVIYGFRDWSGVNLLELLYLPWIGEEWRLHPLIDPGHSKLHQYFLVMYWMLFTTLGFFKKQETKKDETYNLTALLLNSFIFTAAEAHHLHVYYPSLKFLFPLVMGSVYAGLFVAEKKMNRPLFADLYLAFAVIMLCLTVPLYFDGPWITYGWSAASMILIWLGVRHQTKVLRIIAWALAGIVAWRLFSWDYRESQILFHWGLPVRQSFFLFLAASASFLSFVTLYRKSEKLPENERRIVQNYFMVLSSAALACAFLFGGFRTAASVLWTVEAILLMVWALRNHHRVTRVMACILLFFAAMRFGRVDYSLEILKITTDLKIALRLGAAALSLLAIFRLADWMRHEVKDLPESALKTSNIITAVSTFLALCYFLDPGISSWISIIWGALAFIFVTAGFALKDKIYRWCGLSIFAAVALRLFFHDFSKLETIYKIVSFMGMGAVFIAASFLYSYYSKVFLVEEKK